MGGVLRGCSKQKIMRSMGLDIGDRRIGVALSDPSGVLASPLTIIDRRESMLDVRAVIEIVSQHQVSKIIVGLPFSMDGGIGKQAEKTKAFIRELANQTGVQVEYRDERLTTVSAKRLKREAGVKKTGKKIRYDAMAAAIILQGYLDENR